MGLSGSRFRFLKNQITLGTLFPHITCTEKRKHRCFCTKINLYYVMGATVQIHRVISFFTEVGGVKFKAIETSFLVL
jgi:hypothetical protein